MPDRVMQRAASMLDVARLAGVSSQTVSRVSNNSDLVSEETRTRVLAAMNELGYRPNSAARALKSGRFQSIGVLMFSLQNVGPISMLDAINVTAASRGYSIDLISVLDPDTGEITLALSRLDMEAVDGIVIVLEAHLLESRAIRFPTRIPSVIIDSQPHPDHIAVNADQRQGTELAVRHLLDLGHPTVWHVSGPVDSSNAAAEREEAWRALLEAQGREVPPPLIAGWTAEAGYQAGRALAAQPQVSAVFCANDQLALGVMRALHEAGRDIPGDVSIVGFDDTPESAQFWPPLTTVHQDFGAVGSTAIDLLFQLIDGDHVPEGGVHRIPNTLVVRDSTGPYRGRL